MNTLWEEETQENISGARMAGAPRRSGAPDNFQTPAYALDPLFAHLPTHWYIWEPSCGKGNLVRAFRERGYDCTGSDIMTGQDFLLWQPERFDCIVGNPPFSIKEEFLTRCYSFGKPFALLMPFTALEGKMRQSLYRPYGVELILMPNRINFETPNGKGSGSWFPSCWFTWGLNLPQQINFWQPEKGQARLFEEGDE